MLGKNSVSSYRSLKDGFLVHSTFLSIQGEGPFAGQPSLFIRFAGCSHKCVGCDTDFDGGITLSLEQLIARIESQLPHGLSYRIVLSGGEPMLQSLTELIHELRANGHKYIDIETAGTNWPAGFATVAHLVNIVCSPKTANIDYRIADAAVAFKYVVREGHVDPNDGLPLLSMWMAAKQLPVVGKTRLFRADRTPKEIYIQPYDAHDIEADHRNLMLCAELSMQFGYRFSVQLHKIVGME